VHLLVISHTPLEVCRNVIQRMYTTCWRGGKVEKSAYWVRHIYLYLRKSVRLSAFISSASTARISEKFYIGDLYENLSRNSKFG
jgi:hypothetical protein